MPTYHTAAPDMTPPASSGRHLSKLKKRQKMPPAKALVRIILARRFAWLKQMVGFLVSRTTVWVFQFWSVK